MGQSLLLELRKGRSQGGPRSQHFRKFFQTEVGLWFEFRFEWTYVSHITSFLLYIAVHCGSTVKNLPAMWESWVRCLGWEDPLEEGMATHSSILAWRISMGYSQWGFIELSCNLGVAKNQTRLSDYHTHRYICVCLY